MDTLLTLRVEELSPSNEAYKRGYKFAHYRKMATLCEYLLVTQEQPIIERYVRQEDVCILSEAVGLDVTLPLESIGCVLSLREVYEKVFDFEDRSISGV